MSQSDFLNSGSLLRILTSLNLEYVFCHIRKSLVHICGLPSFAFLETAYYHFHPRRKFNPFSLFGIQLLGWFLYQRFLLTIYVSV